MIMREHGFRIVEIAVSYITLSYGKVNIIIILIYMVAVGTAFQLLPPLPFVNHVLSFFFSLYLISRNCKEYISIYT